MAFLILLMCACVVVRAAPPSEPRFYHQPPPGQLQQINPLDYYLDNPEESNYYQQQHKSANGNQNGAPARLENLDPNSEVEIISGDQQPNQTPQQNPVVPNIPGLVPGQRVFFVVPMPMPGSNPGGVGGYRPIYILTNGAQGNTGYPGNGYQNNVLFDPSGQGVVSPLGYPRPGLGGNHLVYGGGPLLQRPYDFVYQQDPLAYHPAHGGGQLVAVPLPVAQSPAAAPKPNNGAVNSEPKTGEVRAETKESVEEERRNARPVPPHAQTTRNKP